MAGCLVSVDPGVGRWLQCCLPPETGRAADRVCLSPVPRPPGRAVSLLGFILVRGPLLPHNLRGPPSLGPASSLHLSSWTQGSGCASLQEHRLCFLKMILTNWKINENKIASLPLPSSQTLCVCKCIYTGNTYTHVYIDIYT